MKGRRRKLTGDPPAYFYSEVQRTRATIDQERSGFVWERPRKVCRECRKGGGIKRWKRIVLEDGTWSGEDIFIPRGLQVYVTSERFKEFCEQERITNVVLVPAEGYWGDLEPWDNWEKAREIMTQPVGGPILEKRSSDGKRIFRYDARGGYLVTATAKGKIREIERPVEGIECWKTL